MTGIVEPVDGRLPDSHSLVMHQSSGWQRSRTEALVADAIARGDKVLHGTVDVTSPPAELGEAGRVARESGQLELVDARRSHEQTDGLHWALRQLHEEQIRQAFDAGYPGVLLTADDHALRVLAPEPAERLAYEHDLERLTALPGVRALCCYDLRVEQPDLLDAVAGLHYRAVEDVSWSARLVGGRLLVRGELDMDNAGRFGAALRVAAAHGVGTIDLAEVTMVSAAGIRAFDGAVDLLARRAVRLRLVNMTPMVRRALELLRFDDERRVELIAGPDGPGDTAAGQVSGQISEAQRAAVASTLATLTRTLLGRSTVAAVLQGISDAAVELVPGVHAASVTLRDPAGDFHTPVSSGEIALELDHLQYQLGEGPCVEAARSAGLAVAVSENLTTDEAWPRFGPAAVEHGVRAIMSTALLPDRNPSTLAGALNLYSRQAGAVSDLDQDLALLLADHASLALAPVEGTGRTDLAAAPPSAAIDSAEVLDRATDMLVRRRTIAAAEALGRLLVVAQGLDARLTDRRAGTNDNGRLDGIDR
jgi:anti-anti-sigma factor